jgi:xylan 1,4-beta-xylosidase
MNPFQTGRRSFMTTAALASAGAVLPDAAAAAPTATGCQPAPQWASGADGQRKADLGQGMFLNPIVAGDHPDPTILKDGADYYMTFSSCQTYPGAVIWHSRDLVNWAPLGPALRRNIGIVWAMDLIKHGGRYFLYIPVLRDTGMGIFVTYTDDIRGGAWSDPIDLGITGHIDPGHAVGEDGHRYLFLNGIKRVRLTADGLATAGPLEHAHSPWRYPEDWVVEMFAPEGPKLLRHGGYFYMISAVGGTAGPATSHMVTLARSRSIHGPWEDCPGNPIVRTKSADEPWWSRGHASAVEGPAGDWWMVYHGYENGYRTLGRQVLLEPVEWTADGWLRAKGGTLAQPLPKPRGGRPGPAAPALSDDFRTNRLGTQWVFFEPAGDESDRVRIADGELALRAKGKSLADCSPLLCTVPDRNYEAQIELEVDDGAQGGLALFYDGRCHTGLGFGGGRTVVYHYGQNLDWARSDAKARRYRIRVHNVDHNVTFFYSLDDGPWIKHDWQREVSGFHHNVFGGFLALRIAIFASGRGQVRCGNFRYRALPA